MKDCQFKNIKTLKDLVFSEHLAQMEKWGVQDCSPFEWLAYTTEELGELAEAIQDCCYSFGSIQHVIDEAIQVATLSLKIAEMYMEERDNNLAKRTAKLLIEIAEMSMEGKNNDLPKEA